MRHRWVVQTFYGVLLLSAFWMINHDSSHPILAWGLYFAFLLGSAIWGQRIQRDNRRMLTIMWGLADELGYTAADLKRLSGKYGELDWAATRPERITFFPGVKVITQVTHAMQREQGI